MPSKSDKEKKPIKKAAPEADELDPAKKVSSKSKKDDEEEDDDIDVDTDAPLKKGGKAPASKKQNKDDDDEEDATDDEEADDWEKVEEEDNWDPDFDEFDLPKSKTTKAGGTKKGKGGDEDDLGLEDDFKEMDLFDDRGFDDDDDDF